MTRRQHPRPESTTSADGTAIGFVLQGTGPGIVLVQGAMATVAAYERLARALSVAFTVISAERRGRGISPLPYDRGHDIARDVEDLDAVMAATGARTLFGLSSGAVITLEAARTLSRVERIVAYEPPFYDHGMDRKTTTRLFDDIERGDLPSALLDSLIAAGTAPTFLARLPRAAARLLAATVLAVDGARRQNGPPLRELLPGVRYDFHDVATVDGHLGRFASVTQPVLLLSGTSSPAFLRRAARELQQQLTNAQHVELTGLGHDGPWNNGDPDAVARTIRDFLEDTP